MRCTYGIIIMMRLSFKPLEVRWLCQLHHSQWHANNKARGNSGAVNFRLEPEIYKALAKVARRKNLSRNAYVDQVLRTALEKDGGLPK
jgi:hypothetical protein